MLADAFSISFGDLVSRSTGICFGGLVACLFSGYDLYSSTAHAQIGNWCCWHDGVSVVLPRGFLISAWFASREIAGLIYEDLVPATPSIWIVGGFPRASRRIVGVQWLPKGVRHDATAQIPGLLTWCDCPNTWTINDNNYYALEVAKEISLQYREGTNKPLKISG